MVELQRATMKPVDSVFIFNIAVARLTMADELEFMTFKSIWQTVVISFSWKEFQKIDGTPTHKTHLCNTVWSQRARHTRCAWHKTMRYLQASFVSKTSFVIWCVAFLIHGCSLTRLLHHDHFLFFTFLSDYTTTTLSTSRISQSTSCQKHRGRVVLRCNIVRNDSGSYAVFTEQRSSATEMTATKLMEIFWRLYHDVQDKQYPLTPKSKWKMHRRY